MIFKYLFTQWTVEKNCWWLVRDYYKEQLGIELPLYCVSLPDVRERIPVIIESLKKDWQPIYEPEINCLVGMGRKSEITHVGIYIAKGKILHLIENHTGILESIFSIKTSFKTVNFYKYASSNL
jgi:hypothetical protein